MRVIINIFIVFMAAFIVQHTASLPTHSSDNKQKSSKNKAQDPSTSSLSAGTSTSGESKFQPRKSKTDKSTKITSTATTLENKECQIEEELKLMFKMIDKNGDGLLSKKELEEFFVELDEDVPTAKTIVYTSMTGTKKKGFMNFEEFKKIFGDYYSAAGNNTSLPTHSSDNKQKSSKNNAQDPSTSSLSEGTSTSGASQFSHRKSKTDKSTKITSTTATTSVDNKEIPSTTYVKEMSKKNKEKRKKQLQKEKETSSISPTTTSNRKFDEGLKLLFRVMDEDKNNIVFVKDLMKYMSASGQDVEYCRQEFSKMNRNKDGVISYQAIKDYLENKDSQIEEELKLAFKMIDKNGDDLLSKKELEEFFVKLDEDVPTAKMVVYTLLTGTKKKGFMNFEEFKKIFGDNYSAAGNNTGKKDYASSSRQKGNKFEKNSLTELFFKSMGPKTAAEEGLLLSFKKLDKDKDGFLGEKDMEDYLKSIGQDSSEQGVKRNMEIIGTNENGKIGIVEYMAYLKSKDRMNETEWKDAFDSIDTDQDGYITAKDFTNYNKKIFGESVDPEVLDRSVFSNPLLVEKKGLMDFEEYKSMQELFSVAALNNN